MKKLSIILIAVIVLASILVVPTMCATENVDIFSQYVADNSTGAELLSFNADSKHQIASMVKIMTANLVFEAIDRGELKLDEKLNISSNSAGMGGSQMFLDANADYLVSDLIKGVVVVSANDASVALGERISGSHEGFVNLMNTRAKELGMKNTLFANATGLPSESEQYSTARDVNIMTRALMSHSLYFKYASVWLEDFTHPSGRVTQLANTNKLLRQYNGCIGGKTGYTASAGFCLSACAERNGFKVVSTVIGAKDSKSRFASVIKGFNYAYGNYKSELICKKGSELEFKAPVKNSPVKEIAVAPAQDLTILSKINDKGAVEYVMNNNLKAPIYAGDKVGEAIVKIGNTTKTIDIVACESARKSTFGDWLKNISSKW